MATNSISDRPLAPASVPVLVGVVAFSLLISYGIAERAGNDWLAVFAFVATMGLASIVLDRAGRQEAQRHPHRLYRGDRLPTEKGALRTGLRIVTCVILLAYVIATATPDTFGSPMPYFIAIIVLYLVIPQAVARWAVVRDVRSGRSGQ